MKVKLSFGHKAVISSLSKLNMESKNFFYKSCLVWYAIKDYDKKVKVKLSFGQKTVISSLSKLNIESKNFFYESCSIWYAIWYYHIKNES